MIRMSKPLARYLLSVLHYLHIEAPEKEKEFNSQEPADWASRWSSRQTLTTNRMRRLYDTESGHFPAQMGIDASIEKLERHVDSNRQGISDLIEALAEVLKSRFARNQLSREGIQALRNVILRDEENTEAIKLLKSNTLACIECGHKFISTSNEAVSLTRNKEGEYLITCSKCIYPRVWACKEECDGTSQIPIEFLNLWVEKSKLLTCGGKHPKKKKADEETLDEAVYGRSPSRPALPDVTAPSLGVTGQPLSTVAESLRQFQWAAGNIRNRIRPAGPNDGQGQAVVTSSPTPLGISTAFLDDF